MAALREAISASALSATSVRAFLAVQPRWEQSWLVAVAGDLGVSGPLKGHNPPPSADRLRSMWAECRCCRIHRFPARSAGSKAIALVYGIANKFHTSDGGALHWSLFLAGAVLGTAKKTYQISMKETLVFY